MTILERRPLEGVDSRYREIDALGGLYIVPPEAHAGEVGEEVLTRDIRALEVQTPDLGFLAGLPVEFLILNTPRPDIRPVNGLDQLRSIVVDAWTGDLDLSTLPSLRWFGATEPEKAQVAALLGQGHDGLDHLAIGKWSQPDLRDLERFPRLSHLEVGNSRVLAGLEGASQLRHLRVLELSRCPALTGLEGIAGTRLEHLGIETCNKITDLTPLASLPALRSVQIELPKPPPLEPLFGHPSLEFVWLIGGKRPPEELDALLNLPSARLVQSSRALWMREAREWGPVPDIYAMTDEQQAAYERLHDERNAIKSW